MLRKVEEIKEYWDQQAILARKSEKDSALRLYDKARNVFYNRGSGGTSKDLTLKDLETEALLAQIQAVGPKSIMEVGCGSGLMTIELANRYEGAAFHGVDYSSEMIANAQMELENLDEVVASRLSFDVADALHLSSAFRPGQFNLILTDRCLINLADWDMQKKAISEIQSLLLSGGVFLMLEGSQQGLENLNSVRHKFGMDSIVPVWHNLFFDETKLLPFVEPFFVVKEVDNFCSTYMLVSRVLHHKLKDQDASFNAPINEMAAFLPNMGEYSYLKLYVFVKK